MILFFCTDMEGLAGIDKWDQCYAPDDNSPIYRYGREQLTAEVNAAAAGAFDGGAGEVRVLDGHGRNQNKGFIPELLDKRIRKCWIESRNPVRWEGVDESVNGLAIIGQHAMAGTVNGFLDHTQATKILCRLTINGVEHGEPSQFTLYSGHYNIPLIYTSGDEALCAEMRRLFPQSINTPTKRGTGWATCELYPSDKVRENIRRDIAQAVRGAGKCKPWKPPTPIEVAIEYAWSELADGPAIIPGVERPHARTVKWRIDDPRDIYGVPSASWKPSQTKR